MSEPQVRATHYEVTVVPHERANGRWYTVHVADHGRGRWVVYREHCAPGEAKPVLLYLAPDGAWSEIESSIWFAPNYVLEEALELARAAAPRVVVGGVSAAEEMAREDAHFMFRDHPDLNGVAPVRPGEEPTP